MISEAAEMREYYADKAAGKLEALRKQNADLLAALKECEMHVSALSALTPPRSVNMDAARAAAHQARAAIKAAEGES